MAVIHDCLSGISNNSGGGPKFSPAGTVQQFGLLSAHGRDLW